MADQILLGLLFALVISLASFLAGFLTPGGSVAQFLLGWILFGLGEWQWTLPILLFFLSSSLLSEIGKAQRSEVVSQFEKPSRRDAGQVFANGGIAGLLVIFWFYSREYGFYIAYLGSIAAATADTWGTEIGILSQSPPRLITTLRSAETGRSGAVSFRGFIGGLIGSTVVSLIALPWLPTHSAGNSLVASVFGGCFGFVVDSLLGATIQVQYRCVSCGRITERNNHCGVDSPRSSGIAWMTNDVVNLTCTMAGSIGAAALLILTK